MSSENGAQDLDSQILQRMLQDFLQEARQHLDQLNLNLIQLEEDPAAEDTIQVIFRTVHSLKGSAAFAGLKQISELARSMEDVFGSVRKGILDITAGTIQTLYEAVDVLTMLIDKAGSGGEPEADVAFMLDKLAAIQNADAASKAPAPDIVQAAAGDSNELLAIYKSAYDQLAALKHLTYASAHLTDPESLAGLFSKQIEEGLEPERNAVWLVAGDRQVEEIARDGRILEKNERRVLTIDASEILKVVIHDQMTVWPSRNPQEIKAMLPGYRAPVLFPIKSQPQAFGFLVLDPEESAEVEIYQFIGQFAAMMLNISKLHQKVQMQRKELDEMTGILFKQNAQLSALYHIGVEMMNAKDPVDLFRILVEAAVCDLEAQKAAVFLMEEASQNLVGVVQSGGFEGFESLELSIEAEALMRQAMETGRLVSYRDTAEGLCLGDDLLKDWILIPLKGRKQTRGVMLAVVEDEDIVDPISILINNAGILLDNLRLMESTPFQEIEKPPQRSVGSLES